MKISIIKIGLGLILLFLNLIAPAQAFKATYTYDANGNRLTANVIYMTSSLKSTLLSLDSLNIKGDTIGLPKDGWDKGLTDLSDNFVATVYPNPVHGLLIIELTNMSSLNTNNNSIRIWNMQGNEVFNLTNPTSTNKFDLSDLVNGTYVLRIFINGATKEYKVIKN
jgi:hypothetical protein